jgi:hypothetical protein
MWKALRSMAGFVEACRHASWCETRSTCSNSLASPLVPSRRAGRHSLLGSVISRCSARSSLAARLGHLSLLGSVISRCSARSSLGSVISRLGHLSARSSLAKISPRIGDDDRAEQRVASRSAGRNERRGEKRTYIKSYSI